LYQIKAVKELN